MALAVALLVVFVGGLYFITHNKPGELPLLPNHDPRTGNGLPPKPEERWRYIKELENRQIGVPMPTEPSAGGEVNAKTELTNEQRQLLEQMQADMRQQPTQLSEVPYNQGMQQVPRSAVTIKPPATSVQPQPVTPPRQTTIPVQPQAPAPVRTPPAAPVTQAVTPPKVEKRKKKHNAGWCNVAHSKPLIRQNLSALNWHLRVSKAVLPRAVAGIAWCLAPTIVRLPQIKPCSVYKVQVNQDAFPSLLGVEKS